MPGVSLEPPSLGRLPSYLEALRRGWCPDNVRGAEAAAEEIAQICEDPVAFVASLVRSSGDLGTIRLPDGSLVPRLPGFTRWIVDGGVVGSIGFRHQPGGPDLPPHVLGHVGYGVAPWARNRGVAKAALRLMLGEIAACTDLPWVDLTTDVGNAPSQAVIRALGGVPMGEFTKGGQYGGRRGLRWRIFQRCM